MPADRSPARFAERRSTRLATLVSAALLALAGCGGGGTDDPEEAPSELTGVITELERDAGRISGMSLETPDGTYEVRIPSDVNYGFDLEHLEEHRAESLPVRCELEERDGDLVALTIVDA